MIQVPTIFNPTLRTFENPTIQLDMVNNAAVAQDFYVGGGWLLQDFYNNFGEAYLNSNFADGLSGWNSVGTPPDYTWSVVPGGVEVTNTILAGGFTYSLDQDLTLSVGSVYKVQVDFDIVGGAFTGFLNTSFAVGVPYVGASGSQSYQINYVPSVPFATYGIFFNILPATPLGVQIIVRRISLIDTSASTAYYQYFNNIIPYNPVRMRCTRLIFGTEAQIYTPIRYVIGTVTGNTQEIPIPLTMFQNPSYTAGNRNILDLPAHISYALSGTNYLQFTLPPGGSLKYIADIAEQVSPIISPF